MDQGLTIANIASSDTTTVAARHSCNSWKPSPLPVVQPVADTRPKVAPDVDAVHILTQRIANQPPFNLRITSMQHLDTSSRLYSVVWDM